MAEGDDMIKVRMSREFAESLFTRDAEGRRLRVEWGEMLPDGFYSPAIHVDYTDWLGHPSDDHKTWTPETPG